MANCSAEKQMPRIKAEPENQGHQDRQTQIDLSGQVTDHADEKQIPTTTDGEARKPRGNASLWANLLDDQPMALPQVLAGLVREQVNNETTRTRIEDDRNTAMNTYSKFSALHSAPVTNVSYNGTLENADCGPTSAGISTESSTTATPIDVSKLQGRKRARSPSKENEESSKKRVSTTSMGRQLGTGIKTQTIIRTTQRLRRLENDLLARASKAVGRPDQLSEIYTSTREYIHKLDYDVDISMQVIMYSRILEAGGLPRLIANAIPGIHFPWDVVLDAKALSDRWTRKDKDSDILRGLRLQGHVYFPEPNYAFGYRADFHGAGHLVIGQWYANHQCAKVHGAHGSPESGISGNVKEGAFSIVLSSGYSNEDGGNTITYCGTKGERPNKPTISTQYMLTAYEKRRSVRVLRSANMPPTNVYRPAVGIRYDGLYRITDCNLHNPEKSDYRFQLTRNGGQAPIRYQGPEKRPTDVEEQKYQVMRDTLKNPA